MTRTILFVLMLVLLTGCDNAKPEMTVKSVMPLTYLSLENGYALAKLIINDDHVKFAVIYDNSFSCRGVGQTAIHNWGFRFEKGDGTELTCLNNLGNDTVVMKDKKYNLTEGNVFVLDSSEKPYKMTQLPLLLKKEDSGIKRLYEACKEFIKLTDQINKTSE
ncbi:MAG: hypothetical protein E3J72_08475 [Planctomycetota bacterium]|nr:MAG: hypothetical protein E3J72_08475 [Planctomycetota bacterium]